MERRKFIQTSALGLSVVSFFGLSSFDLSTPTELKAFKGIRLSSKVQDHILEFANSLKQNLNSLDLDYPRFSDVILPKKFVSFINPTGDYQFVYENRSGNLVKFQLKNGKRSTVIKTILT